MHKRKTIQVDEATWRNLRQRALDAGLSVAAIVRSLVEPVGLAPVQASQRRIDTERAYADLSRSAVPSARAFDNSANEFTYVKDE